MGKLVHIEIPYEARYMSEAQIDQLLAVSFIPLTKPTKEAAGEKEGTFYLFDAEKVVVDEDALPLLTFRYTVVRRQRNSDSDLEELRQRATTVINKKINIAVPGFGLMSIDEVQVETDLCTESLQGFLDSGWRILVICPQPDQRRPDYVLGRTKAQAEKSESRY